MLRIALPNKGMLAEGAMELVREAGYWCRRLDGELVLRDVENEVEFVFLRETGWLGALSGKSWPGEVRAGFWELEDSGILKRNN